jgi:glycosyltransferase involved in cell wall biosynthesis
LKILYHHRTAARDGMSVHIEQLVAALRALGHEVRIVGPLDSPAADSKGKASAFEVFSERIREILPRAAFELIEMAYNIPAYFRLQRVYRSFAPDILYERYNLFLRAGLWLKRKHKIPMILEVNSPLVEERMRHGGLRLERLARRFETSIWQEADAVLPVTGVIARQIIDARHTEKGVLVVPNGVDLAQFHKSPAPQRDVTRRKLGLENAVVLGFTGFIREWHGVEWAIDALASLPKETHLLIVGDGPAREKMLARSEEAGVRAQIHFVGRVAHDEVPAYVSAFDIALQPRSVPYASPLKLFEYMATSLPVVAPDQPNIREVVKHNETALLFTPDDYRSFFECVKALSEDAALRSRIGRAARALIEETPYTWQHNAERVAALGNALSPKTAS